MPCEAKEQDHLFGMSALAEMPSLWIHGAAMTGKTWDVICSDLPHAIAPDLPGRAGLAFSPSQSVEAYATSLESKLRDHTLLVGHSLGGMVALELAARWPERVSALVLIEAVSTVRENALPPSQPGIRRELFCFAMG